MILSRLPFLFIAVLINLIQGRTKWRNCRLSPKHPDYQLGQAFLAGYPTTQYLFYVVKILSTLHNCCITSRVHIIEGHSTVPPLCSSLTSSGIVLKTLSKSNIFCQSFNSQTQIAKSWDKNTCLAPLVITFASDLWVLLVLERYCDICWKFLRY